MGQILAWKCDEDGALFEDKKQYQAHLRKLALERRKKRKLEKLAQERESFLCTMGQVGSIAELIEFIKSNWDWFVLNGYAHHFPSPKKQIQKHELIDLKITDVRWDPYIANTHSCPLKGVTNFYQTDDAPKNYAGWRGRITIIVRPPMYKYRGKEYVSDGHGSAYFYNTLITTGTGGGGGITLNSGLQCRKYTYSIELWADNFPVMNENRLKQEFWKQLSGKTVEFV